MNDLGGSEGPALSEEDRDGKTTEAEMDSWWPGRRAGLGVGAGGLGSAAVLHLDSVVGPWSHGGSNAQNSPGVAPAPASWFGDAAQVPKVEPAAEPR